MMRALMLSLLLTACGRSGIYGQPQLIAQDAGTKVVPPVGQCTHRCETAPDGVLQPTSSEGQTLHWETCRGCVAITLDPRLMTTRADLDRAAATWATGSLCFRETTLNADFPWDAGTTEPRLHLFALDATSATQPLLATSTLTYDRKTGAVLASAAEASLDYPLTPRHLAQLIGRGLGYLANTGDSLMNEMRDGPASLTDGDVKVHRQMYGTPPWCER